MKGGGLRSAKLPPAAAVGGGEEERTASSREAWRPLPSKAKEQQSGSRFREGLKKDMSSSEKCTSARDSPKRSLSIAAGDLLLRLVSPARSHLFMAGRRERGTHEEGASDTECGKSLPSRRLREGRRVSWGGSVETPSKGKSHIGS